MIEAVYMAIIYLCEGRAITMFQNDYEIIFWYDN